MIAPDSSVLVAGFDPAHPFFSEAQGALGEVRRDGLLVAHTLAETLAVLTAGPYAVDPSSVRKYLALFLERRPAGVPPAEYPRALARLTDAGVEGGAIYDGLIALGARQADATLVSLDRRASRTYRRCGVEFRLLIPEPPATAAQ